MKSLIFTILLTFGSLCHSFHFNLKYYHRNIKPVNLAVKSSNLFANLNPSVDLDNVESTNSDLSGLNVIQKNLIILYKFCRPHTIKGNKTISHVGNDQIFDYNLLFCSTLYEFY